MSWSVLGYCWSWGSLNHCKMGSVQVERLQYVPWALKYRNSHGGTGNWTPWLRNGRRSSWTDPEYLDALWQSLLLRVRRFGFSLSSLSPGPFSSRSICFWGPWPFPPWEGLSVGGTRGDMNVWAERMAPKLWASLSWPLGLCEREKGHFQADEVSANISCQSDSGPQLE